MLKALTQVLRVAQDDNQPQAGPWNDVILRSGATKNLVFDSNSPESIFFKKPGRVEDFRFFQVQPVKIPVARDKHVHILRDG